MLRQNIFAVCLLPFTYACSQAAPPASAPVPAAKALEKAEPTAKADEPDHPAPNPQEIQAAVQEHSDEIRQCYVMGTFRDSQLAGTVHVRFVIESSGKVVEAADGGSNMPDPDVVECVLGVFASLEFRAGKYYPTEVEYPIRFGKS